MKMEQTECSETLAYKIQTPWNYPEEGIHHSEQGESLKSRTLILRSVTFFRSCNLFHNVKKYGTATHTTDDNVKWCMRFACWITEAMHTPRICDTSCFTMATMFTKMHLNFMFMHTFLLLLVLQCVIS